jgi:phenylacetate-CoA ligase
VSISQETIYDAVPIWMQNGLVTLYGYKLRKARFGNVYYKHLDLYQNKNYTDIDAELSNQNHEIQALLQHATTRSPYYKKAFEDIDISKIKTAADLAQLPILEKETLRANIDDFYTITPDQAVKAYTGGTTGKSLMVYYTKGDFQKRMAYLDAFKIRCGVDPLKDKKVTFSGRSFARGFFNKNRNIFWRSNFAYKQKLYSTFDLSEDNLPYYLADLNKYKPDIINGFVSAIYELAKYITANKCRLDFQPKAIFTTSETLLPFHREAIERAFNAKIFNQYASAEGAPFVTECIAGNLHYNIDTGVIEILDCEEGNEILVTSFTSYGTPLIRYRIGDSIHFKEGVCSCGSAHPLVESVDGRKVEYLLSETRGKISLSHLADVIKGVSNGVKEMQFVQEKINSLTIKIVIDDKYYDQAIESKIIREMKYRFGDKSRIVIEQVESIEREASGKKLLVKRLISNDGATQ